MLSVHYAPDVSPAMIELLEHHARHAGVSLDALEIIGASLDFVEAFIIAAEDGQALDFVASLAPDGPLLRPREAQIALARLQAERLFG